MLRDKRSKHPREAVSESQHMKKERKLLWSRQTNTGRLQETNLFCRLHSKAKEGKERDIFGLESSMKLRQEAISPPHQFGR